MKQTLFKSVCLALMWCGMVMTATAQGIVVNKMDGTKVFYKASEVLSVGVYGYGEGPDDTPEAHEYVDLGLPSGTLWATCNVGAEKPEEYGDYFAWSETQSKENYNWATYRYYDTTYSIVTKYCTSSSSGTVDNKTELEMGDDAATVNWGIEWQMPSLEQFSELINSEYTTTTWTTLNGVNGRMIVSKSNGNRIFLPAAGYRNDASLLSAGTFGRYWSRSLNTDSPLYGRRLFFSSNNISADNYSRCSGQSVRPVRVQN